VIGKIEKLPVREIWEHEALNFTVWLQKNIDTLGDAIDMKLTSAEREHSTGNFSVDLVAEDELGNIVVIENQLEKSNHDHLGKIITYLSAVGARIAVWIVSEARAEHINAVSWLNTSTEAEFYLVKIEAIKIGNSNPAPLFKLIVGPSEETKEVGETKKELAERYSIRYNFWQKLLEMAKAKTKLHATISPGKDSWVGTGAGKSGLSYNYSITGHYAKVELYIDRGKDKDEENKAIFDELLAQRNAIEKEFGGPLEWERLENRRPCRIAKYVDEGGYKDPEKWSDIIEKMIENMIKLERALSPFVKKLDY
jgi:hypothetical protein